MGYSVKSFSVQKSLALFIENGRIPERLKGAKNEFKRSEASSKKSEHSPEEFEYITILQVVLSIIITLQVDLAIIIMLQVDLAKDILSNAGVSAGVGRVGRPD